MVFGRLAANEAAVQRLAVFLDVRDVIVLVASSSACRRLCPAALRSLDCRALGSGAPAAALFALVASPLTGRGAGILEIHAPFCGWMGAEVWKGLPELTTLRVVDLDGCQGVDDDGLVELAKRCRHLHTFSLYWNVKATDRGFGRVLRAQRGQDLRVLNFSGCKYLGDETVQRIVTRAPLVVELDLTRCPQVTDAGALLVFECMERLRVLRLYAMAQLNPQAFTSMHKLTHLEELDLCGCRVEDESVVKWLEASAPAELKILNLTWTPALTDASVAAIHRCCPVLDWLSLFGNTTITRVELDAMSFAPCGKTIRWLDIRGMTAAGELSADAALPRHQAVPKLRQLFPALLRTDLHH